MIAYLDMPSGVSGDILLGCLVDAGWPVEDFRATIAGLNLPPELWAVQQERVMRGPLAATLLDVRVTEGDSHRHLSDIVAILDAAALPQGSDGTGQGGLSTAGAGRGERPRDERRVGPFPRGGRAGCDHRHRGGVRRAVCAGDHRGCLRRRCRWAKAGRTAHTGGFRCLPRRRWRCWRRRARRPDPHPAPASW